MTKGILIPFDNDEPIREVEFNGLQDMYQLIDCQTVDRIGTDKLTFWCDDEGLFHPEARERMNARAMQLLAYETGNGIGDFGSPMVGNFLIDGPAGLRGEETDVPDWVKGFAFTWSTKPPKEDATNG
ncbi:hypothetical protein WILDE_69 [Arthrobacter phage Wilde]|uniref:DUF3846 domain-containing protein n=1 Tax=Arthrobacter phage Wilde TaxID=1772323 RepID=A0A0U4JLF6_9CAUD|nr:hypothetical protein WILDE_69 [Arthrobacter phage Wilde]